MLDQCAGSLGVEAFTADDGSIYDSPVRLKIPELVAALRQKAAELNQALLNALDALAVEQSEHASAVVKVAELEANAPCALCKEVAALRAQSSWASRNGL